MPIDTYPAPVQSTPGAVLGSAQLLTNVALSTTEVDLGLAVTVAVPVGRTIRVTAHVPGVFGISANMCVVYKLYEGATELQESAQYGGAGFTGAGVDVSAVLTPTQGVHTYKVRAVLSNGTCSTYAGATTPAYIVVEDITGGSGGTGPISLGYAQVIANQGSITTEVDLTGLTVTVNVPANRRLKITGKGVAVKDGTGAYAIGWIYRDGVRIGKWGDALLAANGEDNWCGSYIDTPSAGAHTYKLTMRSFTGAVTLYADNSADQGPAWILVEDITGTAAPAMALASSSTLGYAEATANQGSITTEVDLTGLSVTINVPAGRRIRITGHTYPNSTVAIDDTLLRIKEGATQLHQASLTYASGGRGEFLDASIVISPSAGTHTYKLTMQRSAGTGTVTNNASATYPSFILVEDITGGAIPAAPISVPVGQLGFSVGTTITTIAAETTLPGYSVNVVVPAGRVLRITACGHVFANTTTGQACLFRVKEDGVEVGGCQTVNVITSAVSDEWNVAVVRTPAAGAHTYTVTAQRNTGADTLTNRVSSAESGYLLVEDITPTPAPANTAPSSTVGYAEVTSNQSGITTEVDLTGLSSVVTVSAGRRLKISGRGRWQTDTVGAGVLVSIYEDASMIQQYAMKTPYNNTSLDFHVERVLTPSAGTHTYKLRMAQYTSGTVLLGAAASIPASITVEDITGASLTQVDPVPIGTVAMTALATAPYGWLICDGAAVSRTQWALLFAVMGTLYGTGDGSTTFNLPNLKGRVVVGYDASQTEFNAVAKTGGVKTMTLNEMPVHTHVQDAHGHLLDGRADDATTTGAWYNDVEQTTQGVQSAVNNGVNNATATNQNAGVGAAGGNLPPYMAMNYIIKAM